MSLQAAMWVVVTLHLSWRPGAPRPADGVVSLGLPLPPQVQDVQRLAVRAGGRTLPAHVEELLAVYDKNGARIGPRSALIQLPAALVPPGGLDVAVDFAGAAAAQAGTPRQPYRSAAISAPSAEVVAVAARTVGWKGALTLVQGPVQQRVMFTGVEPHVLVSYPPGYLASTGILGHQFTAAQVQADKRLAGLRYLSSAFSAFTRSALYEENYPLDPESVPDPAKNYEGWLYDRCATLLLAFVHTGDQRFQRAALRHCSHYADQIKLGPPDAGIFKGKPDPDTKYSHLRGLYAYYALTGDEAALHAGQAIAQMWLDDPMFVKPYLAGHTRGPDKLWTERLLGTSLEGLYYGHLLTGERRYLDAARALFEVAYRHITGDAAALAQINPGVNLPPQNCFIHSAAQQAEGDAKDPWCSGWMSELLVDPLLRYQEQTGDRRVDEVFIRLARFLRDVGSSYFHKDVLKDHFLSPQVCDDPKDTEDRRRLVPLYGAGIDAQGQWRSYPEYADSQHCPDATALTAAALRALRREGRYDQGPIGPFPSEGASILQLHHELSACAEWTFSEQTRLNRDPATWTSKLLQEHQAELVDPVKFIRDQKIGYPSHNVTPVRRLSWWFNTSMEQFGLLTEAGIEIPRLQPGRIQPPHCH